MNSSSLQNRSVSEMRTLIPPGIELQGGRTTHRMDDTSVSIPSLDCWPL